MPTKPRGDAPASGSTLNARLRLLRQEHSLSLQELASRAGVTKGFLSLVERGLKAPSISTLMALSEAFDVPIGRLFDSGGGDGRGYSLVRRPDRRKYAREGSLYGYK